MTSLPHHSPQDVRKICSGSSGKSVRVNALKMLCAPTRYIKLSAKKDQQKKNPHCQPTAQALRRRRSGPLGRLSLRWVGTWVVSMEELTLWDRLRVGKVHRELYASVARDARLGDEAGRHGHDVARALQPAAPPVRREELHELALAVDGPVLLARVGEEVLLEDGWRRCRVSM